MLVVELMMLKYHDDDYVRVVVDVDAAFWLASDCSLLACLLRCFSPCFTHLVVLVRPWLIFLS
jgi:hypothetical protein